jgi:hypothetical protein
MTANREGIRSAGNRSQPLGAACLAVSPLGRPSPVHYELGVEAPHQRLGLAAAFDELTDAI